MKSLTSTGAGSSMKEIEQQLAAAQAAQKRGDTEDAINHLQTVLAADPAHPVAWNSMGVIALEAGDPEQAVDFHRRATDADANAPVLWLNLAKAQRAARDDDGERASLSKALSLDGLFFMALLRKAELHQRLGEIAQALPAWQGALATAPESPPPALAAILAAGAAFIAEQTGNFAREVDGGLASIRASATGDLRRFDAAVGHATGRRRIYVNECAGLHFPFLPADEYFDRELFPWLPALEANTDAIRNELTSLLENGAPGFAPYVQMAPGTPDNKWTPLDASTAWSSYYLWKYGQPIADAHARCPKTVAALAALPRLELSSRAPSAFFSLLEPGAHIPAHTGVTNVRVTVHLPLIIPQNCYFRVGGETRQWEIGRAFAFDDTIEHEAWNNSNELRAILIIDAWNPHLTETERTMMQRYFEIADASDLNPGLDERF
jgi:aspartate beta-hydroxylase